MPEHLEPPPVPVGSDSPDGDYDSLRFFSRSPHPYRRLNSELLEPSDRVRYANRPSLANVRTDSATASTYSFPSFARESPLPSESGTEADDEHFLKGLPAPKARLHKGVKGRNEPLSGTSTPLSSSTVLEKEAGWNTQLGASHVENKSDRRDAAERLRRRKELLRRAGEVLLLGCQATMVASNPDVRPIVRQYRKELLSAASVVACLVTAYPLRLVAWTYRHGKPSGHIPIRIPAAFDPAPLLYPTLLPIFVSLLVSQNVPGAVLPSLVLGICALPRQLIPGAQSGEFLSHVHWLLSCVPFTLDKYTAAATPALRGENILGEVLVLLYPLHQSLCLILHHLTTTSLLVSELQLLSVGLISLLLLARSPQAVVLKALLWGGGIGLIVSCGQVIQWGISLARVPKWRFRRAPSAKSESGLQLLWQLVPFQRRRSGSRTSQDSDDSGTEHSNGEYVDGATPAPRTKSIPAGGLSDTETAQILSGDLHSNYAHPSQQDHTPRRHTLPATTTATARAKSTTPSGRRKRAASSSVRAFFSLTQAQATVRKWLYALYVYICILAVILGGIRAYVQHHALAGAEPLGWALGYLLGDIPSFRFHVVKANLERWICLPPRRPSLFSSSSSTTSCPPNSATCSLGWVQHARLTSLGPATTRLALLAYWLLILLVGLATVVRLTPLCEVDTRRKVFHFMMVGMLLPATYVDPCYAALALGLVLAVFLLLDLLRASQLPPLSRPVARFLVPYVDGRDLRGPVVVSHIFLLVGCAAPLWLSLAALPRGGSRLDCSAGDGVGAGDIGSNGWDVPTREVSMVAGVVCVGLGDAAASLVGRRWGVRKWVWGGGKSIEGSLAFAGAVFAGLMAAAVWLRVGGWPVTPVGGQVAPGTTATSGWDSLMSVLDWDMLWPWLRAQAPRTAVCASLASLTEAVLTGGNDNVVVPVVLWGCVKSLGV